MARRRARRDLVWSRAADLDAVIIPTNFTDRLESLAAAATRYPTVRVALDHCAFTDMGGASKSWLARHATRHLDQQRRSWIFSGTAVELGWVSAR